jgi:general secretion pathway protein A
MYEQYYGFREKPFNLTPDPKYLFLSAGHQEAMAHLEFGRRERGGFMLLTGEVGTGKTTLARHFLAHLDAGAATAVILYPAVTAAELLRTILQDLRVTFAPEASLGELVRRLHEFLLEARARSREVVLLIDEAQDLTPEVLEQVRLISNLETDTEKLIQIVLMGQSELASMLERPELRQLAQRLTVRYHLTGLRRDECAEYVRHRLRVAGGEGKVSFTEGALRAVHQRSTGLPRVINLLCDRALLAGYVNGTRTITPAMVERAARETSLRARPVTRMLASLTGIALLVLLSAAGLALWRSPTRPPALTPETAAPPSQTTTEDRLRPTLLALDHQASYRSARAQIQALWGAGEVSITALQSHMAQIRKLDLPVILEMAHPARPDTCYVALVRLQGDEALVRFGDSTLHASVPELERHWTRLAHFPWRDDSLPASDAAGRDAWARQALARLGYSEHDLKEATTRFQREADLAPDGTIGSRTLMALFCLSGRQHPSLRQGAS